MREAAARTRLQPLGRPRFGLEQREPGDDAGPGREDGERAPERLEMAGGGDQCRGQCSDEREQAAQAVQGMEHGGGRGGLSVRVFLRSRMTAG